MSTAWRLARKDLRSLVRSRTLLAILLAYPLVIAVLLGTLLLSATESASLALVDEDRTGDSIQIGEKSFGIDRYKRQAERAGVDIVEMQRDEAMRALDEGQVQGVLVIPNGFVAKLQTALAPGELDFYTGDSTLGAVITQRVRGVVYNVNLQISAALVEYNAEYLKTLVEGGEVEVVDRTYDVLGLQPTKQKLESVRGELQTDAARDDVDEVINFAEEAVIALDLADNALNAAAAPVRLNHKQTTGKSPKLTARAMSFAMAVSIAFICVILVAASLASERDENVLGRLLRGIASGWQILLGKLLVGVLLAVGFSVGLFAVFAILAPQAWSRLPLLVLAVAISALAFSALGTLLATLTRDARTATLVGILLVLPLIPLGLLPANDGAYALSQAFPFGPSQQLFNDTLFESDPWSEFARGALHLLALAAIAFAGSRLLLRRLV